MTDTVTSRPNVVVVLLDDVGFAAPGAFGGAIDTPALDALAADGLRYNRFHTTAICSPTRASLLTGRDAHVTGVGTVLNSSFDHPAYCGVLRDETATIARVLQLNGYATGCFGKWHLAPTWESTQAGPFDRWPTGRGFDHFYGFLGGETQQFEPTLYEGTTPVEPTDDPDYHLTEDLASHTIDWIRMQQAADPNRPFFAYVAPGATHAPLQVPLQWAEKYQGRFDQGWDAIRAGILERQIATGAVPEGTELTPRPEEIPAWDSLSDGERKVAARMMEVYAGFLEHTDVQIGRIADELRHQGIFDNTLFVYVVGDNGGSGEGGPSGSISYFGGLNGMLESLDHQLANLDKLGTRESYAQYPVGWAWAMSTPMQWLKQVASHLGGTRNAMVLSYPNGIESSGEFRNQYGHVNDLTPTILDLAGIEMPEIVDGVAQEPIDGVSLRPTFNDPNAPEAHRQQYFEVFGHRAIYQDGWMASANHGGMPWMVGRPGEARDFEADEWELYNLDEDFSQAHNLADQHPEKVQELVALFQQEAERAKIWPLQDARVSRTPMPNLTEGRTTFRYYPGAVGFPEDQAPRLTGRSWHLQAKVVTTANTKGVIFTVGGRPNGCALWLAEGAVPTFRYRTFEVAEVEIAGQPLTPGEHLIELTQRYQGPGIARGADFTLVVDGEVVAEGGLPVTPPRFFSIDETFDIGSTSGSPVGNFPARFPFQGGTLVQVDLELDS